MFLPRRPFLLKLWEAPIRLWMLDADFPVHGWCWEFVYQKGLEELGEDYMPTAQGLGSHRDTTLLHHLHAVMCVACCPLHTHCITEGAAIPLPQDSNRLLCQSWDPLTIDFEPNVIMHLAIPFLQYQHPQSAGLGGHSYFGNGSVQAFKHPSALGHWLSSDGYAICEGSCWWQQHLGYCSRSSAWSFYGRM